MRKLNYWYLFDPVCHLCAMKIEHWFHHAITWNSFVLLQLSNYHISFLALHFHLCGISSALPPPSPSAVCCSLIYRILHLVLHNKSRIYWMLFFVLGFSVLQCQNISKVFFNKFKYFIQQYSSYKLDIYKITYQGQ